MKNKKLNLLQETVSYYSENPLRICRASFDGEAHCFYDGLKNPNTESDGCAVGRLLPQELKEYLDTVFTFNKVASSVSEVFQHLPLDIQEYGVQFLRRLQGLHDTLDYWDEKGLTETGKVFIKNFIVDIENNLI